MTPSPLSPAAELDRGDRLLAILLLGIAGTVIGLALVCGVCAALVPPVARDADFNAKWTVYDAYFYFGQPAKTVAYGIGMLATPVLLALSLTGVRRLVLHMPEPMVRKLNVGLFVLYIATLAWCAWPMFFCADPPMATMPPAWLLLPVTISHPFWTPIRAICLLSMATLGVLLVRAPATPGQKRKALGLLLALWVVLLPTRFYYAGLLNDWTIYTYHLNSLFDAMSQSINGRHLLIDFPHIYGGYGELLAPFIRLFPRDFNVLVASLALPDALGMLALLLTARLLIRRPAILLACGLALFSTAYGLLLRDIYYAYGAARFFLPPVGLLCATVYFRNGTRRWYVASTVVAAVSTLWNLDTGVVLWTSWLLTLVARDLAAQNRWACVIHAARQAGALLIAWGAFFVYLRTVAGQWPDLGLLFYFQRLVVGQGYFCLRMIVPDMWVFVLLIYLVGLAVPFWAYTRGHASWRTAPTLMIALLGTGLFSYYMGRSAASNLVTAGYPAVLLLGIFYAESELWLHRGLLPAVARHFLLPFKLALFWWALLCAVQLSDMLVRSADVVVHWARPGPAPVLVNAAYVQNQTEPGEPGVLILSGYSGIYYYLSGTVRAVKTPDLVELLRTSDLQKLMDGIRARQVTKLFVENNFYSTDMYRPDIYDSIRAAIVQNYRPVGESPTHNLTLYLPR